MEKYICSICNKEFEGYSNNAYPVTDGVCCDSCNLEVVVPARIALLSKTDKNSIESNGGNRTNE